MKPSGSSDASAARSRIATSAAIMLYAIILVACGETYRPVAQPIQGLQPSPGAAHIVFSVNSDGVTDNHRSNGSVSNIDVSGDSVQGNLKVGLAPAHAALLPNGSKLYVANSGEDSVTANNTSAPTTVAATVSLPASPSVQITSVSSGGTNATYTYSGTVQIEIGETVFVTGCSTPGFNGAYPVNAVSSNTFTVSNSTPATGMDCPNAQAKTPNAVFVHAADNSNVYVAGYTTNSVYVINTTTNVVTATVPLGGTTPPGIHPVAIAEVPNAQQVYVANRGNAAAGFGGTVSVISTVNNTVVQTISPAVGAVPVWVVAKSDGSRVYVLDENGTIYDINPTTYAVTSVASIGTGSNFLAFDPVLNRLYVTNPTNSQLGILDATTDPPTLFQPPITVCSGCSPDSVTVLGDGSRAYVGAYQFSSGCTDASGNAVNCVNSSVAVIDGPSATLKSVISSVGSGPALTTTGCGLESAPAPNLWQPGTARFRVSVAASGGGSNSQFKVYVGQCDAGSVAVIDTYAVSGRIADSYSGISLTAPLSTFPALSTGTPPPQNPVLVLAGP